MSGSVADTYVQTTRSLNPFTKEAAFMVNATDQTIQGTYHTFKVVSITTRKTFSGFSINFGQKMYVVVPTAIGIGNKT